MFLPFSGSVCTCSSDTRPPTVAVGCVDQRRSGIHFYGRRDSYKGQLEIHWRVWLTSNVIPVALPLLKPWPSAVTL